jgi:hypothetical protein
MCLNTRRPVRDLPKIVTGYKVWSSIYDFSKSVSRPKALLGKTYKAEGEFVLRDDAGDIPYRVGFHVWKALAAAKRWGRIDGGPIYRVELSQLTAIGGQCGSTVYVGRRMKLIRRVS